MNGIFNLNTPYGLFSLLRKKYFKFCYREPSDENLVITLFCMYHLREWICPNGKERIINKNLNKLDREELLFNDLFALKEYRIIQELCNRVKHYTIKENYHSTSKKSSYMTCEDTVGLPLVNDKYFVIIDNQEVNIISLFQKVFETYKAYFDETIRT